MSDTESRIQKEVDIRLSCNFSEPESITAMLNQFSEQLAEESIGDDTGTVRDMSIAVRTQAKAIGDLFSEFQRIGVGPYRLCHALLNAWSMILATCIHGNAPDEQEALTASKDFGEKFAGLLASSVEGMTSQDARLPVVRADDSSSRSVNEVLESLREALDQANDNTVH